MDTLTIQGVAPWDGEYPLDAEAEPFTYREWGYLKRYANYLPLTLKDGLEGSDPVLFAVLALIVLRRAGRIQESELQATFERFLDAPFSLEEGTTVRLHLEPDPEEGDAAGPPQESSNGNSSISGTSSSRNSGPVGTPVSATSGSPQPA